MGWETRHSLIRFLGGQEVIYLLLEGNYVSLFIPTNGTVCERGNEIFITIIALFTIPSNNAVKIKNTKIVC